MKNLFALTLLIAAYTGSGTVFAYPPDNAAVIYYYCGMSFSQPDNKLWDQVSNLYNSTDPIPQAVKEYLLKQRKDSVIKQLQTASQIEHCDWGLNYSEGFTLKLPHLQKMKNFAQLILADGALAASEGDYTTALKDNLTVRRFAWHVSNDNFLISFLVSKSICKLSDAALRNIVSAYPLDAAALSDLKKELLLERYHPASIRQTLTFLKDWELQKSRDITREVFSEAVSADNGSKVDEKKIKWAPDGKLDPDYRNRLNQYTDQFLNTVLSLLDKPYPQAYSEIQNAVQKTITDSDQGNTAAYLPSLTAAQYPKVYSHFISWKTDYNALLTSLDVCIIAKQTGKLPQKLESDPSYVDCFSGQPFLYEKTKDGFILRGRQKNLSDNKIPEYTFKLPAK